MAIDKSGDTKREWGLQSKLFDDLESVTCSVGSDTQKKCHGKPSEDMDNVRTLLCPDCKKEFLCSLEELDLHRKYDSSRPIRCPTCRLAAYVRHRRKPRRKS